MPGYQGPTIPIYLAKPKPELKDLLDTLRLNIMSSVNCHAVGTVNSFKQAVGPNGQPNGLYTVQCTINYQRTYFNRLADGTYQAQTVDYPTLIDCPTVILGGGSTYLQFPIKAGDQCLILFNDRDLNNWFAGARTGPVATARMHSIADGIALVGFQNVSAYDGSHALLSNGLAQVGVPADAGDAHVRIANNMTTLYTVLSQLITAIEGITVSAGSFNVGGSPVTGVSGTVSNTTALESARTAIQGLLE